MRIDRVSVRLFDLCHAKRDEMTPHLLILGWHNVEGTWSFPALPGQGSRGLFRQLSTVRRLGTVVDLREALDDLSAGRPLPHRAVALTFDDGYRDNLVNAKPVLARYGIPATLFLATGFVDQDTPFWWDELATMILASTQPVHCLLYTSPSPRD